MGATGHFFINHELRGTGLGVYIVDAICRKLASENEDAVGFIHKCNEASIKSALKGGSKIINYDYQILINLKPLNDSEECKI